MKKRAAKRQGRPRKPPDKVKGLLLQVRLEVAEKQAFTDAAQLAGQDVSVWVRDRLRRMARQELEEAGRPVAFLSSQEQGKIR